MMIRLAAADKAFVNPSELIRILERNSAVVIIIKARYSITAADTFHGVNVSNIRNTKLVFGRPTGYN